MNQVRILVADDYDVVRRGIKAILDTKETWTVVAEAASGREAVEKARRFKPDIVVLEIRMPELNGLDAMRQILKDSPRTQVLIFTTDESEDLAQEALASGAHGYLFKSDKERDLVAAVESLSQDKPFFTLRVSRMVLENYRKLYLAGKGNPTHIHLSLREREILQLVAEGMSTKEIAGILIVSGKTVETHRANIMRKLNLRSVTDLVRYAIRNHIITP
jgi:DNA-binding NarL/FixJ family response regulator